MFRKILVSVLGLSLCLTTFSCMSPRVQNTSAPVINQVQKSPVLPDGKYPVQQVSYSDADGRYSLMLLDTPAGTRPMFQTQRLEMARLGNEQIKQNTKSFLEIKNKEPILYLTEDFKIDYVHAVTETRMDPSTGGRQEVVVRQENSSWSPFFGAIAGQAIGNALFRPQYYVPPVYQGSAMRGFGGYGTSYNDAVGSYQNRYNQPPAAVRNRQVLRSSGSFYGGTATRSYPGGYSNYSNRSSGAGFGSSRLNSSGRSNSYSPSRSSFGSSRRSFGSSSMRRR